MIDTGFSFHVSFWGLVVFADEAMSNGNVCKSAYLYASDTVADGFGGCYRYFN